MLQEAIVAVYEPIEPWYVDGVPVPSDVRLRKLQKHALRMQGMKCEIIAALADLYKGWLEKICAGLCPDCEAGKRVAWDGMHWWHPDTGHNCKAMQVRIVAKRTDAGGM